MIVVKIVVSLLPSQCQWFVSPETSSLCQSSYGEKRTRRQYFLKRTSCFLEIFSLNAWHQLFEGWIALSTG